MTRIGATIDGGQPGAFCSPSAGRRSQRGKSSDGEPNQGLSIGRLGPLDVRPAPSLLGPFEPVGAEAVAVSGLYSGRLVQRRDGSWAMLGFVSDDGRGAFVGEITDPIPFERLLPRDREVAPPVAETTSG